MEDEGEEEDEDEDEDDEEEPEWANEVMSAVQWQPSLAVHQHGLQAAPPAAGLVDLHSLCQQLDSLQQAQLHKQSLQSLQVSMWACSHTLC